MIQVYGSRERGRRAVRALPGKQSLSVTPEGGEKGSSHLAREAIDVTQPELKVYVASGRLGSTFGAVLMRSGHFGNNRRLRRDCGGES